jgi:hypothetical protein
MTGIEQVRSTKSEVRSQKSEVRSTKYEVARQGRDVRSGLAAMVALAVCIAAVGCDEDPARAVKIIERTPAGTAVAATPSSAGTASSAGAVSTPSAAPGGVAAAARPSAKPRPGWHPEACPPPPEASGPGNLNVTGPCEFHHRAAVSCESYGDDFIVAATRKAANGATLVMYMNVEQYHGPGKYDEGQMFVAVQDGKSMYRWTNDNVRVEIGAGEAFAIVSEARLEAEPMLVDCKRVIGPETNYQYDCGGYTDEKTPLDTTFEVVAGKLQCGTVKKE